MFGSDSFPLGPNGQFPKQRISSAGNEIAAPEQMEGLYSASGGVRLPVVERDFHSSLNRIKGRMKQGKMMRIGQNAQKFRPRGRNLMSLFRAGLGEWSFGKRIGVIKQSKRWVRDRYGNMILV